MKAIDFAESHFDCEVGPPMAYFTPDGFDDRVTYVTYALRSSDTIALDSAMVRTFRALEDTGGRKLYWRNKDKIEITFDDESALHQIWTRIAVTDYANKEIRIEEMVKPEGEPSMELEDDSE